eukprot:Tbor_TRINITY_DN4817_c0_g1::TRINITY_DN4817_c0_g1_i1::g.1274::m.1274
MRHSNSTHRGAKVQFIKPLKIIGCIIILILMIFSFIAYTLGTQFMIHDHDRTEKVTEKVIPVRLPPIRLEDTYVPASPNASAYVLRIVVFTYNRVQGLKRLLRSLNDAHYNHIHNELRVSAGDLLYPATVGKVSLTIYLDHPKEKDKGNIDGTRDFLDNEFVWPHGDVTVHHRERNVGLKRNIMEAWYPTPRHLTGNRATPREFCAFFEDDTEVSPQWFRWVDQALKTYVPEMLLLPKDSIIQRNSKPSKLLGLSLFRPIKDELSNRLVPIDTDGNPFILQQPCSWGAVYFPDQWLMFRQWYRGLPKSYSPRVYDPDKGINPSSNTWATESSWKKYLIQFMYIKGMYMIYPNLPQNYVLSTNHLMKGEHITPERKYFELPIYAMNQLDKKDGATSHDSELLKFAPVEQLRCFDIMFRDCGRGPSNLHNYEE